MSASTLVQALAKLGYIVTRQTGSHIRLTTQQKGEHHLTIPAHNPKHTWRLSIIKSGIYYEVHSINS
ncbi:type II toxin-antitoxin system HicA family toxin [Gloeocapsopsis crepidinum]|uniref:type II toxin-antitoxin system HicA family toxin n=1 Tax=Gloeocapsopsis crepidinum TaxID=693223 RepID=UPI001D15CC2B|nr:type II toxin-antitoxin system HicA family toxin [Gloeocapsopsis crepidinum]